MSKFTINHNDFSATVGNKKHYLTPTEYRILTQLVANADKVVTKEELLANASSGANTENSIEVYIKYLRNKLGDDAIGVLMAS